MNEVRQETRKADKINYSMVFAPAEWDDGLIPPNPVYGDPPEDPLVREDREQRLAEYREQETEYREAVEWLEQWYPCSHSALTTGRRVLLLVGTESYPEEVWSCRRNHYRTKCYLEWRREEETEEQP